MNLQQFNENMQNGQMSASTTQPDTAQASNQETEIGLDENVAAAVAYVLGFVTGIILILVESDNKRVRFHAAQSIIVFGGLAIFSFGLSFIQAVAGFGNMAGFLIGSLFSLLSFIIWVGAFIVWVFLIVRTYQGKDPRMPGAAGMADSFA